MSPNAIEGSELLGLAASMIVVVGTIILLGWLYSRSNVIRGRGSDIINIVASRAIGNRERLLIIEVAGQQMLIGTTASQVQTLHVFDAPAVDTPAAAPPAGFAHRLTSALKEMRR